MSNQERNKPKKKKHWATPKKFRSITLEKEDQKRLTWLSRKLKLSENKVIMVAIAHLEESERLKLAA